jgi:hypothetical protein
VQGIVAIPNAGNALIAESKASANENREVSKPYFNKVTRGRIIFL